MTDITRSSSIPVAARRPGRRCKAQCKPSASLIFFLCKQALTGDDSKTEDQVWREALAIKACSQHPSSFGPVDN